MTPEERTAVVTEVRSRMSETGMPLDRTCLYWACTTVRVLRSLGHKALLQAGDVAWRYRREDDGVSSMYFAYYWSPATPTSILAMARGNLPEMHVWAAAWTGPGATPQIVDLSTMYFPAQCHRLLGQEWTADLPPDYLWVSPEDLPDDAHYAPHMDAISYVLRRLSAEWLDAI